MQKQLTLRHIKRHPEKLTRFDKVRIWSGEWHAWWRPDACGYTKDIEQAGIYAVGEAMKCCGHCGPKKKIRLVAA
jgi:hypothetical protein